MDKVAALIVFSEVAKTGSFATTAKHLGFTPSGISRKISKLEDRLNVRLFNRTTRTVGLTDAGRVFLKSAHQIIIAMEDAESTIRNMSDIPIGGLKIAASNAFTILVLIPFMREFNAKYSQISIILVQGDGSIDLVNEGVDIAIRFAPPAQTSFISKKIINDPWIICASPQYLQSAGIPFKPEDLVKHKCLTIGTSEGKTDQWQFCRGNTLDTISVPSSISGIGLVMREAALEGLGIARLAHFLVCQDIHMGKLVPLLREFEMPNDRAIHLVFPNKRHLPLKTRLFIDELNVFVKRVLPLPN